MAAGRPDGPALLFDGIKGFPRGFRIFTNATTSPQRAALALGIVFDLTHTGWVGAVKDVVAAKN